MAPRCVSDASLTRLARPKSAILGVEWNHEIHESPEKEAEDSSRPVGTWSSPVWSWSSDHAPTGGGSFCFFFESFVYFVVPLSVSFVVPLCSRMFDGFKSRWRMPCWWA